jgi:hypothetical protein
MLGLFFPAIAGLLNSAGCYQGLSRKREVLNADSSPAQARWPAGERVMTGNENNTSVVLFSGFPLLYKEVATKYRTAHFLQSSPQQAEKAGIFDF